MEQRYDPRYPANLPVWVTDLVRPGYSAAGTISDISNSGICIVAPLPLAPGAVVRLDVSDCVFFGLITHATQEAESWRCGIEIQRVLLGGSDLSRLMQQLLVDEMPAVAQSPLH